MGLFIDPLEMSCNTLNQRPDVNPIQSNLKQIHPKSDRLPVTAKDTLKDEQNGNLSFSAEALQPSPLDRYRFPDDSYEE
jgi:hypothetical protein